MKVVYIIGGIHRRVELRDSNDILVATFRKVKDVDYIISNDLGMLRLMVSFEEREETQIVYNVKEFVLKLL